MQNDLQINWMLLPVNGEVWSECAGDDEEDVPGEPNFDLTEVI